MPARPAKKAAKPQTGPIDPNRAREARERDAARAKAVYAKNRTRLKH